MMFLLRFKFTLKDVKSSVRALGIMKHPEKNNSYLCLTDYILLVPNILLSPSTKYIALSQYQIHCSLVVPNILLSPSTKYSALSQYQIHCSLLVPNILLSPSIKYTALSQYQIYCSLLVPNMLLSSFTFLYISSSIFSLHKINEGDNKLSPTKRKYDDMSITSVNQHFCK